MLRPQTFCSSSSFQTTSSQEPHVSREERLRPQIPLCRQKKGVLVLNCNLSPQPVSAKSSTAQVLEERKRGIKRESYAEENGCLKAVEEMKKAEQRRRRKNTEKNIKLNLEFKQIIQCFVIS